MTNFSEFQSFLVINSSLIDKITLNKISQTKIMKNIIFSKKRLFPLHDLKGLKFDVFSTKAL